MKKILEEVFSYINDNFTIIMAEFAFVVAFLILIYYVRLYVKGRKNVKRR